MYFQFRRDADRWFKDISSHYPTKFDLYYLCAIAGIAAGRKTTVESDQVTDLVEYYPGDFKTRGRLLVGLLLCAELESLGITLEEREEVYGRIRGLLDPNSQSCLNDEGVKLMNQYANGGFDALCEYFSDRPRTAETFVQMYTKCIRELMAKKSAPTTARAASPTSAP